MAKFTFNSNLIELDIENHPFKIDAMEVQAKAPAIREKMNEIVKNAGAETLDGNIIETSCKTVCGAIDDMLGKGRQRSGFCRPRGKLFRLHGPLLFCAESGE